MAPLRTVRLIIDEAAPGPWNMAVDEALLASAGEGGATLRFYRWSQATLSLGYFQAVAERKRHPASTGCPLVRRSTGGGAIVHDKEITYSYTSPLGDRFAADAESLYELFHQALIDALRDYGIEGHRSGRASEGGTPKTDVFLCFQRRSAQDVVVDEVKIAGSAQRRRHGAVLQHGSVLLGASTFAPELAGLGELAGRAVDAADLVEQWTRRLAEHLHAAFEPGRLTADEMIQARALATDKFSTSRWTERR